MCRRFWVEKGAASRIGLARLACEGPKERQFSEQDCGGDPVLNVMRFSRSNGKAKNQKGTSIAMKSILFTAVVCLLCSGRTQLVAAENESIALQCVYISGEVKTPGRYPYTNDLALDKAIEMAKGVTSKASGELVLRREGGKEQTFKLKAIQQGDAKDTKLKPGDKVFVPRKE
jgi:hypothetical protein